VRTDSDGEVGSCGASLASLQNSMQPMARILCPVDFSPASSAALDQALELAAASEGTVEVAHVCNVPYYVRPDLLIWTDSMSRPMAEVAEESAKARLDSLLAPLPPENRARVQTSIHFGPPAATISKLAEARKVNLIVMGTHGRHGISLRLLGSVAERVVREAPCPVLVVRPSEDKEDSERKG